jgi:hypothetical protein
MTIGSVVAACTSVTISADVAIDSISHDAPTDWIIPPNWESRFANQTSRKIGWRNGDHAEVRAPSAALSGSSLVAAVTGRDPGKAGDKHTGAIPPRDYGHSNAFSRLDADAGRPP